MSNDCKKRDCGCEEYLTTPPPCPPSEPCEDYQPCPSYTDARCVIYVGDDIICNEEVVVENGTPLNDIIQELSQRICNNSDSQSDFEISLEREGFGTSCEITMNLNVTGITNYTTTWEIAHAALYTLRIVSSTNDSAVFTRSQLAQQNGQTQITSLIKAIVTDNNTGITKEIYYLVSVDCAP